MLKKLWYQACHPFADLKSRDYRLRMVRLLLLVAIAVITRAQNTCDPTDLLPLASELNTFCRSIIRADLGEVGGEILVSAYVYVLWSWSRGRG